MHQESSSFFDKKTVLAMGLVFAGIFGWNFYLSKKYPPAEVKEDVAVEAPASQENNSLAQTQAPERRTEKGLAQDLPAKEVLAEERLAFYENEKIHIEISSRGMGLRNITIKSYTERDDSPVVLGKDLAENYIFETQGGNLEKIYFSITEDQEGVFVGRAQHRGQDIEKTMTFSRESDKVLIHTKIGHASQPMIVTLSENVSPSKSTSFFLPSYDYESLYVGYEGTNKKVDIRQDTNKLLDEPISNVSVVSLGGHYFTAALVDTSPIIPTVSGSIFEKPQKHATAFLKYNFPELGRDYEILQTAYVGPKDIHLLRDVNEQLVGIVNYGFFSWIAVPILKLLKLFYSLVGNYGVAIILVTLLIRLLLMPINISSYRSMKSMQKVQPLLKAAKEKYKDDPKKVQIETMNIMKEHKVNPLGGCLPMLLQLPIFIALYNVLAMSLELYKAPFAFWIHDLSSKDPYFILPILMGLSMFAQQKITPTVADPAQAKAMQIMPVIFSLFMISLPSGLTLYIFVSTLFGVVQQYMFMNDKKQKVAIPNKAK